MWRNERERERQRLRKRGKRGVSSLKSLKQMTKLLGDKLIKLFFIIWVALH